MRRPNKEWFETFVRQGILDQPINAVIGNIQYDIACDGHALIAIESAEYPKGDVPKKIMDILSPTPKYGVRAYFPALKIACGKPQLKPEKVECHWCKGTGISECMTCGQDCKCDVCDGIGRYTPEPEPSPIDIAGAVVNAGLVARVLMCIEDDGWITLSPMRAGTMLHLSGNGWQAYVMGLDPNRLLFDEIVKFEIGGND